MKARDLIHLPHGTEAPEPSTPCLRGRPTPLSTLNHPRYCTRANTQIITRVAVKNCRKPDLQTPETHAASAYLPP